MKKNLDFIVSKAITETLRVKLNEAVQMQDLQTIKNDLYQMHKKLNGMLRNMAMSGDMESELFQQLSGIDQNIQNVMNSQSLDRIYTN